MCLCKLEFWEEIRQSLLDKFVEVVKLVRFDLGKTALRRPWVSPAVTVRGPIVYLSDFRSEIVEELFWQ